MIPENGLALVADFNLHMALYAHIISQPLIMVDVSIAPLPLRYSIILLVLPPLL